MKLVVTQISARLQGLSLAGQSCRPMGTAERETEGFGDGLTPSGAPPAFGADWGQFLCVCLRGNWRLQPNINISPFLISPI